MPLMNSFSKNKTKNATRMTGRAVTVYQNMQHDIKFHSNLSMNRLQQRLQTVVVVKKSFMKTITMKPVFVEYTKKV